MQTAEGWLSVLGLHGLLSTLWEPIRKHKPWIAALVGAVGLMSIVWPRVRHVPSPPEAWILQSGAKVTCRLFLESKSPSGVLVVFRDAQGSNRTPSSIELALLEKWRELRRQYQKLKGGGPRPGDVEFSVFQFVENLPYVICERNLTDARGELSRLLLKAYSFASEEDARSEFQRGLNGHGHEWAIVVNPDCHTTVPWPKVSAEIRVDYASYRERDGLLQRKGPWLP